MSIDDGPASVTRDDLTAWLSSAVERPDLIPEITQTMAERLPVDPPGYIVFAVARVSDRTFCRMLAVAYIWSAGIALGIALLAYPWGLPPVKMAGLILVLGLGLLAPSYMIADTVRWYLEHPRPTLEEG